MDYNTDSARESLTRPDAFGDALKNDVNFHLTSPTSYQYNCIAYAMGMQDRWVDNADLPWHWWPPVEKGPTIEHLKKAFIYFGFEECGLDDKIDDQYDKIAIYHINGQWQHAARVIDNGIYHSKFGESYDGQHSNGDVLKAQYGSVCAIMRRLKTNSNLTDERKGIAPGVIHLNIKVNINGFIDHLITYNGKTFMSRLDREVKIDKNGQIVLV